MAYNTDDSGSTLTPDERAQEAKRILQRISGKSLDGLTAEARKFISQQQEQFEMFGEVSVSIKQLWWLRMANERIG